MNNLADCPLFAELSSKTATIECMPAVEALYLLPDMGRMTL